MTDAERQMREFAGHRWQYAGNQETAVRAEFGVSLTRYWQVVNRVLDDPDALRFDPQLVRRLRRIRSARATARSRE